MPLDFQVERALNTDLGCGSICEPCERALQDDSSTVRESWLDILESAVSRCIICTNILYLVSNGRDSIDDGSAWLFLTEYYKSGHDLTAVPSRLAEARQKLASVDKEPRYKVSLQTAKLAVDRKKVRLEFLECKASDECGFSSLKEANLGSASSLVLCKHWYETCNNEHSCASKSTWTPTRLLRLEGSTAKLIDTVVDCQYATLSHCWGTASFMNLNSETEDSLRQGYEIADFEPTFRQAMTLALALGISYIWIDSYCIFQDSPHDWNIESQQMGLVYTHAVLNIAATGSSSPKEGLFVSPHRPVQRYTAFRYDGKLYKWWDGLPFRSPCPAGPLQDRAWFRQEARLCTRMLHFADNGLWWQCCQMPLLSEWQCHDRPHTRNLIEDPRDDFEDSTEAFITRTAKFLAVYTRAKLTLPAQDKLRAAEGVLADSFYGHPISSFEKSLLWSSLASSTALASNRPDWSWSSRDGPLFFRISGGRASQGEHLLVQCIVQLPVICIGRPMLVKQVHNFKESSTTLVEATIETSSLSFRASLDYRASVPLTLLPVLSETNFVRLLVLRNNADGSYSRCGTASIGTDGDAMQTILGTTATIVVLA